MPDLVRLVAVATAYVALLFAVATWAERRAARGRPAPGAALGYVLSLTTYCTTWTFYGSVGFATTTGLLFLSVYLGPTLGAALWWHVLRKMVRIKATHRVTSVVDLLSLRYGRSQLLAAIATLSLLAAVVPYVALQLKTMIAAAALLAPQSGARAMRLVGPLFVVLMIAFTIVFGIRRLSPTERHPGMVAALATEGVVKLVAFLSVGAFVTYRLFDGFGDVFGRAADAGLLHGALGQKGSVAAWLTIMPVSALAVVFLPRQFHVAIVESSDEDHVRAATWGFPLYLFAITAFMLPVALGGLLLGHAAAGADAFVLGLPLSHGAPALAWLVFLGGFSAGTAMIMCEAMTVATMVSNHLVLPVIDAVRPLAGLRRHLLATRWCAAALLIVAAFGYVDAFGARYDLVSMGLVAHAGVLVIAPVLLAGLYWRGASTAGALAGVTAGFATWLYTLVVPVLARAGWLPSALLTEGPAGISALRPEALFGIAGLDGFPHATVWILAVSGAAFVLGSVLLPASAEERARVERLVGGIEPAPVRAERGAGAVADVAPKRARIVALLSEYHPREDAQRMADACLERVGVTQEALSPLQLASLQAEVETTLASFMGAAPAHAAMQRAALATPSEARAISRSYARLLAELNVPPTELHRTIDYHRERERLLSHEVGAQRFLAELRGRLAASLDLETTGRSVVDLPVPRMAEAALLWVARPDAKGARAWVCDLDAVGQHRAANALEAVLPTLGAHPIIARAVESRRCVVSRSELDPPPGWPGGLGAPPRFRESATFPLVTGGGALGALTLFASERHGFTFPDDAPLCEEFAHRAAIALENAILLRMAQDAVHARDEFLAVASHELKTPLTPLRLKLQTALRLLSRADPPPREVLAASVRGVDDHLQRVVDLIDQMLDASRLVSDGPRLSLDPTDLGALVRAVVERHRTELDQARCRVSVSVMREVVGSFDRARIGEVVTHLLVNATKYAPGPIEVVVDADALAARVSVRDRGPGIAPQDRERIFRPYERSVSHLQASGFGLGLHLVRRIVEAHGGSVRVQSAPGDGSTFVVELPLVRADVRRNVAPA